MSIVSVNVQTGETTVTDVDAPSFVSPEQDLADRRANMAASAMQIRLALLALGRLAEVEAIVAAADETTQIAWDRATEFPRNSPMIAALAPQTDPPFTADDLDALFTAARQISV